MKTFGELKKKIPPKLYLTALPLFLVLLFVFGYIICDSFLVKCKNDDAKCAEIDSTMVSRVDTAETYADSNVRLDATEQSVKDLSNSLKEKNAELAKANTNVLQKALDLSKSKAEETEANISANEELQKTANNNTKRLEAGKTAADSEVAVKQSEANTVAQQVDGNKNTALNIRTQYSGRYSNRLIWIFLTAIFIALGLAAIVVSVIVSKYSIEGASMPAGKVWKKVGIWAGFSLAVAALFGFFVYLSRENLASLTTPMLLQSIITFEGISAKMLTVFVIFGFVGAIFLISASCVIFNAAVRNKESKKTDEKKLETYSKLLKYLRTILYVGTFMLFVGILRMNYMMSWHLAFVSDSAVQGLILQFTKSQASVLGAFYTILLAAIYLPATFWIKARIAEMDTTPEEEQKMGVAFSNFDVAFRLLAIVSPLIATGFGDSFKWLTFFSGGS